MTSVLTYVAHLPSARSNCVEVTGNNEMSSTAILKHEEAYRPDIDAGCILWGGKMPFVFILSLNLALTMMLRFFL